MFPCPPRRHFVHGQRGELSTLPVLFPILSQHAIPARVVEGKIQQFASGQGQSRGGEFSQCFGQALGSRDPVGDLEEQPVPVTFRRGSSLESDPCFWHAHTSRTCRVQYVAQRILSRNWGSSQLAQLWDYSSTVCVRRRRFLFFGNQSSPRSGSPPQVLRHCFPGLVTLPEKILLLIPGSLTSYTFVYNP